MKAPIINQLTKLKKQSLVSFHTPGHKGGSIYTGLSFKEFLDNMTAFDTTEIPGTDNLFNSKGCILEAQLRASEAFGSQETFFLTNGSTSGIYSMLSAATKPKDKILVDRNCHKSVFNGIFLWDLQPVFIYPEIDETHGIPLGISVASIEEKLKENPDITAVILTYPTYHGIASDLKRIIEIVHKYDKIVLVDEAHGAHLGLSQHLPKTALECGGDAVVQSTHKTLPAFTQSSMLHIQGNRIDRDKLKFMLQLYQSSSPSYLLMASLDLATMIYESKGKLLMDKLLEKISCFRKNIKKIEGINIIEKELIGTGNVADIDITKIWLNMMENNITGVHLEQLLRQNYSIQMELSNLRGALAIATIGNKEEDIPFLLKAIQEISAKKDCSRMDKKISLQFTSPQVGMGLREAYFHKKQTLPIEASEGFISGEYVIPYPPGIPMIIPGEIISREMIRYVSTMKKEGMEILGLRDIMANSIDVVSLT